MEELNRRYTNISRIRTLDTEYDFFNNRIPIEIMATIKDCGSYFATSVYNDEVYFVSTKDTESFGKLSMHFHDPDSVNQKLISFFR